MLPWSAGLAGRIDEHVITSELLRDNPLGDPSERPLWVYVPPGYDGEPGRRYPAVYVIQGYTGHLAMWRNRNPYRQPFPETADAVFADGAAIGLDPALLHRVAVIGSGTLDTLPHNGAVVTLLAVCGSTHRDSYRDIVVVGIIGALVALAAVIALGFLVGSF